MNKQLSRKERRHHTHELTKAAKHKPKSRFWKIAPLVAGLAVFGIAGALLNIGGKKTGEKSDAIRMQPSSQNSISTGIIQVRPNVQLNGPNIIGLEADAFEFGYNERQLACQRYSDFISAIIWNLQKAGAAEPKNESDITQLACKIASTIWSVAEPLPIETVFESFYSWNGPADDQRHSPKGSKGKLRLDCDLSVIVTADVLKCFGINSSIVLLKGHAILKIHVPKGSFAYMETTPFSKERDTFTFYPSEAEVKSVYGPIIWEGEASMGSWWNFVTIAYRSLQSKQYARAASFYRKCLEITPTDAHGWNTLSTCEYKTGNVSEAIKAAKEAIRLEPQNYEYHSDLALIYGANGFFADAEKEIKQAIALNPNDGILFYVLGNALQGQGKTAEAAVNFAHARKLGYTW